MIAFGFFKGMPYEDSEENFDDYRELRNSIPREAVISHIESLDKGLTSLPTKDLFTGEVLQAGIYVDGDFVFPLDFLHYYRNYNIGIPYEYESYLKTILSRSTPEGTRLHFHSQ